MQIIRYILLEAIKYILSTYAYSNSGPFFEKKIEVILRYKMTETIIPKTLKISSSNPNCSLMFIRIIISTIFFKTMVSRILFLGFFVTQYRKEVRRHKTLPSYTYSAVDYRFPVNRTLRGSFRIRFRRRPCFQCNIYM